MSELKVPVTLQSKTLRTVMGEEAFTAMFAKYREVSRVRSRGGGISAPTEKDREIFTDFLLTKSIAATSKKLSVSHAKVLGAIARVTAA